jgi:hypothetical protein
MSDEQLYAAAQYAQLTGLDPFSTGFYAMPQGGITQHYAVLVAWAQDKGRYSDRYELLSEAEREEHGIDEKDTIAFKCYVLRDDRADVLGTYIQAGLPFNEALDFLAAKGIGMVTKADRTTRQGKPQSPPKGWTWQRVAKKRALRDALKQSHGVPTPAELRRYSQQIYQESSEGRLEGLEQQAIEIIDEREQLTPGERQERFERHVDMMRGEPETGIGEDYAASDFDRFIDGVLDNVKWFETPASVKAAMDDLELEYSPEAEEMLLKALDKFASNSADSEAEQGKLL